MDSLGKILVSANSYGALSASFSCWNFLELYSGRAARQGLAIENSLLCTGKHCFQGTIRENILDIASKIGTLAQVF